MPATIELQLASPSAAPPATEGWLHEIKFDGYRTLALVEAGQTRLITRGGLDWSRRYGDLPEAFPRLPVKRGDHRRRDRRARRKGYQPLFRAAGCAVGGGGQQAGVLCVRPAVSRRLGPARGATGRRKALLAQLLARPCQGRSAIQFSDHVEGDGGALYEQRLGAGTRGNRLQAGRWAIHCRAGRRLDEGQGAPDRRLRYCRLYVSAANGGLGRWAWPNVSMASWIIAASSARGSMPRRWRNCWPAGAAAGSTDRLEGAPKESWVRPMPDGARAICDDDHGQGAAPCRV